MGWLETAAFTLVVGAQFLAAVFLIAKRHNVYGEAKQETEPAHEGLPPNLDHQIG
ncbi:MAG TPA: hypothetical protein VJT13_07600 [Xanthobacteraceae bacterium]|nr:hypothetical protein [Xanthobacteraceae bacterium]